MKNKRNYYRVLQVQPDAPFEIIRSCYRTLMRELKNHPDLGGEDWNASIINEAYQTLSDSSKRMKYDKELFESYTKKPFSGKRTVRKPVISIFCPFCKRPMAREAKPGESCQTCKSPLTTDNGNETLHQDSRRSIGRMKKTGTVKYYVSWPQKGEEGEIKDLSLKGIRFVGHRKLKKNMFIKLASSHMHGIAVVTNVSKHIVSGRPLYMVGAKFHAVNFAKSKGSFFSKSV